LKGIILAGGQGTRLFPATHVICKQLLPIYDKPMIYYPLSTLMLTGIKDILIITTSHDLSRFKELLGDGKQLGISLSYKTQDIPRGLADAFIIGEDFIDNDNVCLILGDNLFYGHGLSDMLQNSAIPRKGATIFGYYVNDPERYGVVEFNKNNEVISIEEKPEKPKSNYAIVGLYFYDNDVIDIAKSIKPSNRGEIEITDINKIYLDNKNLKIDIMGRGYSWLDTGTHTAMIDAATFVKMIEDRQNLKIACIEEVAYNMRFINIQQLRNLIKPLDKSNYGKYLINIAEEHSNKIYTKRN
jgi:glucose-1-phosphate thymidylyltransferase